MPSGNTSLPAPNSTSLTGYLRIGLAAELVLFRKPKVLLASLALIVVPSLYVLIYVSSVWDPYGNMRRLPAALVNEDIPVSSAGREIALGLRVASNLERQPPFAFTRYATPEAARAAVRAGDVFLALLIPADFSRKALGTGPPAQLGIYVSEGGNYTASIFAQRFGSELAHTLNETLGRERWAALVGDPGRTAAPTLYEGLLALQTGGRQLADGATKVHEGGVALRDGLRQASNGAGKLAESSVLLAQGSSRLTDGLKQVEVAVTSIRGQLPGDPQLWDLAKGSHALAQGSAELKDGMDRLGEGIPRLEAGAGQLLSGAARVPFAGGKLSAGASQLRSGIATFSEGISRVSIGATQMHEGTNRLDLAIEPLTTGLVRLNAGLQSMSEQLPSRHQLEFLDHSMGQLRDGSAALSDGLKELQSGVIQLEFGTQDLAKGTRDLAAGLDELATRFKAGFDGLDAAKLASPVQVRTETTAPVPKNGPAFAPYFSALSLWVGAVMMSFVFYLRRLPDSLQFAPRPVKWFAKACPLMVLGLLQATMVVIVLKVTLGIRLEYPFLVWLVAGLGSLAFVSLVSLFMSVMGDAGRLLAVVLLILQLAASGGIYPVELSSAFYQNVHGYLPFTFLLRSFRATMFGAFEGRWGLPALQLAVFAVAAMLLSMLLARWKYVSRESYGPAVEF